jgi:hypothetical protein
LWTVLRTTRLTHSVSLSANHTCHPSRRP